MNDIAPNKASIDPLSVYTFDLRVRGYIDPELTEVADDVLAECAQQLTSIGATLLDSEAELPPQLAAPTEQTPWRGMLEEQRAAAVARYALTDREVEIMRLISDGLSNNEIAERLGIGSPTVKTHIKRISRHMGTGDRTRMAGLFNGVIFS